jgi:hypothetical protein
MPREAGAATHVEFGLVPDRNLTAHSLPSNPRALLPCADPLSVSMGRFARTR